MCSTWAIVRSLDMSVSSVNTILRNIQICYPYKIPHVQELLPAELQEYFAPEFLARNEVDDEYLWTILRKNEVHFPFREHVDTELVKYRQQKICSLISRFPFRKVNWVMKIYDIVDIAHCVFEETGHAGPINPIANSERYVRYWR